jgi:membrane protein required for colicin V production
MNTLDIVICVIVGFCFVRGIFRGIVRELASIIGVFIGLYAAYTYHSYVADQLSIMIPDAAHRNIVAFLLIFCTILFLAGLLGTIIRKMLKAACIGWIDRITGSLFGITKGILITSVVLIALTAFLSKKNSIVEKSVLAPFVMQISSGLVEMIPNKLHEYFKANLKGLEGAWTQ